MRKNFRFYDDKCNKTFEFKYKTTQITKMGNQIKIFNLLQ